MVCVNTDVTKPVSLLSPDYHHVPARPVTLALPHDAAVFFKGSVRERAALHVTY
jgi:hypothetical protein